MIAARDSGEFTIFEPLEIATLIGMAFGTRVPYYARRGNGDPGEATYVGTQGHA